VSRIEAAEWHHRALVASMLVELSDAPRRGRELLMAVVGRFFGALCFIGGWFGPMYAAGRLEGANVAQYLDARAAADRLGLDAFVSCLDDMVEEERRHERWFGDRCRGHWLLPIASRVLGWRPPGENRPAEPDQLSSR
jgi:hypothetical protein